MQHSEARREQQISLQLQVQAVVSCLTRMLGAELKFSKRAFQLLTTKSSLYTQGWIFFKGIQTGQQNIYQKYMSKVQREGSVLGKGTSGKYGNLNPISRTHMKVKWRTNSTKLSFASVHAFQHTPNTHIMHTSMLCVCVNLEPCAYQASALPPAELCPSPSDLVFTRS